MDKDVAEKIKRLQANAEQVRLGGKGTARRKKKIVHKTAASDDKKLQSSLKKLSVTNIPGIEEVNSKFTYEGGSDTTRGWWVEISHLLPEVVEHLIRLSELFLPQELTHAQVNMIKEDGTVIHFNNPKVQASVPANTFSVSGGAEVKQMTEMLPGILNQLGSESLTHLKKLANNVTSQFKATDDDVPDLVGDFDEASKNEAKSEAE